MKRTHKLREFTMIKERKKKKKYMRECCKIYVKRRKKKGLCLQLQVINN